MQLDLENQRRSHWLWVWTWLRLDFSPFVFVGTTQVIAFGKPKTFTLSMSVDSTRVSHWAVIPWGDTGGEKDLLLASCSPPPPHFSLLLPISALFLKAPWVRACLFCRLQFSGLEITSHSALSRLLALGASLYSNSLSSWKSAFWRTEGFLDYVLQVKVRLRLKMQTWQRFLWVTRIGESLTSSSLLIFGCGLHCNFLKDK